MGGAVSKKKKKKETNIERKIEYRDSKKKTRTKKKRNKNCKQGENKPTYQQSNT